MLRTIYRLLKKQYLMFLILVVIAFSIIGEMYHLLILSNVKNMTISLNYPGAELGLNPDGSRFNISEMSDDEILNYAKKDLGIENVPNDELKTRLFITTKFSQKTMENVISDIRDGMQSSYVPTTYHIYYSQKNKLAKNETYEFLQALAESYEKYFMKKHAENNSILTYEPENYDFSDYDYSEIYTILYNRSEEMINLIKTHREENRAFRSANNLNFDTVREELTNFKDVTLEKFNSYVIQNNISKDRPVYINKLAYLIDKSGMDYKKNIEASGIAKEALEKYDPKIIAVAFVPSVDNTNSYYMSKTKTGIDDLANDSYNLGMEAAKISKKIDSYNNHYNKLANASDANPANILETDTYLSEILHDFESLSKKIAALDDEYLDYKTESYFTYKITDKSGYVNPLVIIKFALLGFLLGILIIVYMEFFHVFVSGKTKSAKNAITVIKKLG